MPQFLPTRLAEKKLSELPGKELRRDAMLFRNMAAEFFDLPHGKGIDERIGLCGGVGFDSSCLGDIGNGPFWFRDGLGDGERVLTPFVS